MPVTSLIIVQFLIRKKFWKVLGLLYPNDGRSDREMTETMGETMAEATGEMMGEPQSLQLLLEVKK